MAVSRRHRTSKHRHAKKSTGRSMRSRKVAKGKHGSSKKGWFSWLMGGGGIGDHAADVKSSGQLLSSDMYGSPSGVSGETPAFHATTGGRRKSRKQRGGVAPLDSAYSMLLDAADYAKAGLSPEWPTSGGKRRSSRNSRRRNSRRRSSRNRK